MGIIGAPYPDLGETHEHQLIGSAAWEERKQYEADRNAARRATKQHKDHPESKGQQSTQGHYSIHIQIANAVRDVCVTATGTALVRLIDRRLIIDPRVQQGAHLHGHDETALGKQLHHEIINYIEVVHALDMLQRDSETNHRRYLLAVIGGMDDAAIATQDDCTASAVSQSLREARRFLAYQIRDAY